MYDPLTPLMMATEKLVRSRRRQSPEADATMSVPAAATVPKVLKAAKAPVTQSPQLALPFWGPNERGVPNIILRSALFSINKHREMFRKPTLLASLDGFEIRFKGEGFNQVDLDVFETLLHVGQGTPIGEKVIFTAHSMLKALGRKTGKTQHEQLKDELTRLAAGFIEITVMTEGGTKWAIGKKLLEYGREERPDGTHRYYIALDKALYAAYSAGFSHINWQQRLVLKSSLAKWLHGYLTTHAAPYAHKVETLRELCGSATSRTAEFRRMLREALDELKAARAITAWEITETDLVKVKRVPSRSQRNYLANAARR